MIEMYIKDFCPFCSEAKSLLDRKDAKYQIYDINKNPELRKEMVKRSSGSTSVPQIFINNEHIGGCDDLYALEKQNKLDSLLEK